MSIAVAGTILAGGLSRRMGGGDKSLRQVAGTDMLTRVVERLRPQVATMVLSANGDPARFAATGLPVVADPIEGFAGPLAGVLAGLNWASTLEERPTHVATVASDTPFFPGDLVERFVESNDGSDNRIVLAASGGNRQPVFGLWPLSLRDDLTSFMSDTDTFKVLAFVRLHDHRIAEFPMIQINGKPVDPFFNANTPDDIETAEEIAVGATP